MDNNNLFFFAVTIIMIFTFGYSAMVLFPTLKAIEYFLKVSGELAFWVFKPIFFMKKRFEANRILISEIFESISNESDIYFQYHYGDESQGQILEKLVEEQGRISKILIDKGVSWFD